MSTLNTNQKRREQKYFIFDHSTTLNDDLDFSTYDCAFKDNEGWKILLQMALICLRTY